MLSIEFIEYEGSVYDLMIEEDESFVANGIVVHNCSMVPIVRGRPLPRFQSGEDWFRDQPPAVQRKMMGSGTYEEWEDGRFAFDQLATVGEHPVWGPSARVTSLANLLAGKGGL